MRSISNLCLFLGLITGTSLAADIVRDAEYYIIEAQNGERWETEDKALDAKLAEFRNKNGGKPPNIFYILIDDIGFGDLGSKTLNVIRGYETPNINQFATFIFGAYALRDAEIFFPFSA